MKFTEILEELRKGKKVTREKWETAVDACSVYFIVYNQKKGKCEYYLDGRYDDDFVFVWDDITAEDWKIYQENPTQMWKPEFGEKYYYITTSGDVAYNTFNTSLDEYRLSFKNCFKTKKEAQHMVEKIKIINKLRELSNISFNDNCKQEKFVIFYNTENQQIRITQHTFIREIPFNIYFKNKEDCQKAIEIIGEDNLKKYYFDVEEL